MKQFIKIKNVAILSFITLYCNFLFATAISVWSPPFSYRKQNLIPPKVYAVIVGISDYEGTASDLRYSSVDAELFYNNLKSAMPSECARGDVRLLLNADGTSDNIEKAIVEVFNKASASDYILFFFSGHGSKEGYFCPYQIRSDKLTHSFVKEQFFKSKAKYKVCLADACFSGDIVDQSGSLMNQLQGDKIAMLMSSKSYQTSIETASIEQGYFTYYLVKGIKGAADKSGDNYVTLAELFLYVKEEVSDATNNQQVPVVFGSNLNKIPISKVR
ncbi:MAG: caspase family protein [Flavobacteriia bacterium]|nr:caspase family protein [Flavobacteriia bacterium]